LEADPSQLARLLADDAVEGLFPDVIVASGDIGWSCSEEDYKPAEEFFGRLRKKFPAARLVIAPGNHDADLRAKTSDDARQEVFRKFLERVHDADFARQYPLWGPGPSGRDDLVAVERIGPVDAPTALVVAFNSAAGLQSGSTPVRIDPGLLRRLDDHLQSLDVPDGTLKICVLHHHLFPFAEASWEPTGDIAAAAETRADPDLVANSAKLQGWLAQRRFHLVLHGHKHTSHGREDLLWRRNDRSGRSLLIVGAGSAGVEDGHRAKMEPLSFNSITATRLSKERWQVHVDVREVRVDVAIPDVQSFYHYRSITGVQRDEDRAPPSYQAERMDDCHRAIALSTRGRGPQRNFLSTVEDSAYVHPDTAAYGKEPADEARVWNCFRMLHPEYDSDTAWDDVEQYDRRLQEAQLRDKYQFEHGSRLFGSPDRRGRQNAQDVWISSPFLGVVNELMRNPGTSKAYVSLYRADIDVLSPGSEPLPGLMSLQFISRGEFLDVTVTFRKVELSFWWCVNMLEVGLLLSWVCGRVGKRSGQVTFFAAVAQWRDDPEAPVKAALDVLTLSQMLKCVLPPDWVKLADLLDEKQKLTNDNNLDTLGAGVPL
jgi:hypothetical protein